MKRVKTPEERREQWERIAWKISAREGIDFQESMSQLYTRCFARWVSAFIAFALADRDTKALFAYEFEGDEKFWDFVKERCIS